MKRIFIFMFGIILATPSVYSQAVPVGTEDFDGNNVSFTALPANSWAPDAVYHLPGSSATNPKSYLGFVPPLPGNSTTLTTPTYNCVGYDYVLLRFSHICKVSPNDIAKIEYRINTGGGMGTWESLPVETYLGLASNFQQNTFSAASYPEWEADDSSKFPTQDWWRDEVFDLTGYANQFLVQFRFVITHGQIQGSHASYGWLIDNFQLLASSNSLSPPTVEFVAPLFTGTLYGTGPYEINAKVKSSTNAPVKTPWLKYTTTNNGVSSTDSVLMTLVSQNDALWKADIPQFSAGSEVVYSVTGKDTFDNYATTLSRYTIAQGNRMPLILQDGGGNSNSSGNTYNLYVPFSFYKVYSQSMLLYLASEINANTKSGDIYSVGLRVANAGQGPIPIKIWLKTVPASKTQWNSSDNIAWDTLTQDAALVYDGAFNFNTIGWMDIELDNSFYYNGEDNLVVMCEQDCSGGNEVNCYYANNSSLNYPTFYRSTTQTNKVWLTNTAFVLLPDRPDLRIDISSTVPSNSVATHSIDIDDLIIISPNSNVPVAVTVKNKGSVPLSSIKIAYSVNDGNPIEQTLTFNPALEWDFNHKDTLGTYHPKLNGYDTIKVWVSMPNNTADVVIFDDTLTKIVYGSSDIVMRFVRVPEKTVNTTGPHEIIAEIYSCTGVSITPLLYIRSIFERVTTYDSMPMINTSGNLWKVNIPQKVFGNDVYYTIKMTDIMSNSMIIADSFKIKHLECAGISGSFILQNSSLLSSTMSSTYPFYHSYGFSRSMALYPVSEIDASINGLITKIALQVRRSGSGAFPMKIWLKTVPVSKTTWVAATDNLTWSELTQDATLVYDGNFHFNTTGWVDIPLTTPYLYSHSDNLVVMFEQNCGSSNCTGYMTSSSGYSLYNYSTNATSTYWRKQWDDPNSEPTSNPTVSPNRPDIRIEISGCPDSNSVELVSIDSPEETGIVEGNSYPIRVSIRNKGLDTLTSCQIHWKINNGTINTFPYYRNLLEDFIDTITIGTYYPAARQEDNILVWVSLPNGHIDSTLTDDTLMITCLGCSPPLSGVVQVGTGKPYTTINQVLKAIPNCGISGDIIMELTGTFNENVDLTDLLTYMKGYHLTITSANNNADNAVIEPLSGDGITLSNTRNLTLKAITVKPQSTTSSAILFEGDATNITIRDCKLILDSSNASTGLTSNGAIYKKENTGVADSIFLVNNLLSGGDAGFYFYGGTSESLYGTHVIFDSNTVKNNRRNGVYFSYIDFTSCSYNTILSRTVNASTTWDPLDVRFSNGPVTYNRIINRQASITSCQGIYSYYYNYYLTTSKGLIANNEIIHSDIPSVSGGVYAGIYASYSKSKILHNSVYMSGERSMMGIYIIDNSSNSIDIMNNNIVLISSLGNPVHITNLQNINLYNIDYNNYYSQANIGYYGASGYGTAITDMATWKSLVPTDIHSVNVLTPFANDPPTNLKPTNYKGLFCPLRGSVSEDIEKASRLNTTAMGAYTLPVVNQDLTLSDISSWNTLLIDGQTFRVNVEVLNTGTNPVTDVTFGWSVNGVLQSDTTWTPTTALGSFQQANDIPVGTFQVRTNDSATCNVVVWIKSVNGQTETVAWNDTVSVTANVIPLAEFVAPFTNDTISTLSFEVNVMINDITGAPATPPMLYLEAITANNSYHVYDSIEMMGFAGGLWTVTVPKQYYASNVIYSLIVTDTTGAVSILKDTVHIKYPDFGRVDVAIIGTDREGSLSNTGGYDTPINADYAYNWSRQLYLFDEVCPSGSSLGTYIKKIAWESNTILGLFDNQTCYMRATNDISIIASYIDPLNTANDFQQVWAGSLNVSPKGWAELTLDVPFYLPYGKNLDIVWYNEHGIGLHLLSRYCWYQSPTPTGATMSGSAKSEDSLPKGSATIRAYRTNLKVTTEDGAAFESYDGNNLGLVSIASPVNSVDLTCLPDFAPIRVSLQNLGENDYDFSTDSTVLHAEIIDPYQTKHTLSTVINSGGLVSSEMRVVEIASSFPLMDAGLYDIKIWLENSIDRIVYDDTLFYTYSSGRAGLPIADDFSGSILSDKFISRSIIPLEGAKWELYTDSTNQIVPPEGNGMLRYAGSYGTMTELKTRQLDLYRVSDPKLTFWYYHDASTSDLDHSYTEVNIVVDNVPFNVRTLFRKGAITGWVKDSIDLTPYINSQCVYVQFMSMNKYDSLSVQYLAFVTITSTPDLSVSSILVSPDVSVCDFTNKNVSVVVTTTMNQAIDFSELQPDLEVQVGSQTFTYPLRHIIQGSSSDTILIANNLDLTGVTNIKAYLTVPVDRYASNDTANFVIDIQPALSVKVKSLTGGVACFNKEVPVQQEILLENTGNVDLSGIRLELRITGGDNYKDTVREVGTIDLLANSSISYTFENSYIVPAENLYRVQVIVWLECNSTITASDAVDECVDLDDIAVTTLVNPSAQTDIVGATENITVTVENKSDNKTFQNLIMIATIENGNGQRINSSVGTISTLLPFSSQQVTFPDSYVVPNDQVYSLRIYINRVDNYPENDTLFVQRETNVGINSTEGHSGFTLGQNIPNPATNSTRINYSVPEAGEVVFHVHSISGQLLYSKTISVESGAHSLELNTSTLSAGIYYYSIEYKGQRLVKQLGITN